MQKNPALKVGAGALAALAVGFGVSACGSSTAAGVATAPAQGLTSAAAPVTTPTSGPLSKEPTYAKSSAPAPTKLEVKTLVQGSGPAATSSDDVTINFDGFLYSTGKKFSGGSTWTSSTAATPDGPTPITGFVPGFTQGLTGVKTGSRVEVIIPPSLAYGAKGNSSIPANATLVFVIDLLKVSAGTGATSAAG